MDFKRVRREMGRPAKPVSRAALGRFDTGLVGLASLAAIAAYVFQPVQRFASPELIFLGGLFLVMGLVPVSVLRRQDVHPLQLWGGAAIIVFAAGHFYFVADAALRRNAWNDRRCVRIQSAMLRPTPQTRTDLADVFTALGCNPQGGEPVDPSWKPIRPGSGSPPELRAVAKHSAFLERALKEEVLLNVETTEGGGGLPSPPARTMGSEGIKRVPLKGSGH